MKKYVYVSESIQEDPKKVILKVGQKFNLRNRVYILAKTGVQEDSFYPQYNLINIESGNPYYLMASSLEQIALLMNQDRVDFELMGG